MPICSYNTKLFGTAMSMVNTRTRCMLDSVTFQTWHIVSHFSSSFSAFNHLPPLSQPIFSAASSPHINTTLIANMSSGNNPANGRANGPANTPANNQANGPASTPANTSANGPANNPVNTTAIIPLRTRTDIPTVTMDTAKVQGALILLHMDNPSAVRRLYVGPQDVLPLVHYGEAAHTLTTLADPATAPTSGQCPGCNEQKCFTCGHCGCHNIQSGTVYAPTSFCRNDQSDPMSAQTLSHCEGCSQPKCMTCGHCSCRNNW